MLRKSLCMYMNGNNKLSVNKSEMQVFNKITGWWHPAGPSQILYFLRKFLTPDTNIVTPLLGKDILDVGCGAGFLSQSLARLGGNVIGLDPNLTSYNQALAHKSNKSQLNNLKYYNLSLQQFLTKTQTQKQTKKFDIATSMQVIEHVNQPQQFLNVLSSSIKQGGLLMLSTIRRTPLSWLTHIMMAENVLNIVPKGTHHHQQFINPEECSRMLSNSGCETLDILELQINWKGQLQQKKGGSNYLIMGRKKTKQLPLQKE